MRMVGDEDIQEGKRYKLRTMYDISAHGDSFRMTRETLAYIISILEKFLSETSSGVTYELDFGFVFRLRRWMIVAAQRNGITCIPSQNSRSIEASILFVIVMF